MRAAPPLTLWREGRTPVRIGRGLGLAVIGQRLNPTGWPRLTQAIITRDARFVRQVARRQVGAGAVALDINAYLLDHPTDETDALSWAVGVVSSAVDVPLCPDSANPAALLAALEACPGKPLVNSINGARAVLDRLLPAIAARQAAVIVLPYDEGGIPPDAEGRLRVAARVLDQAIAAGLPLENMIVDCLAYPASAGPAARETTVRTIRLIAGELGAHTIAAAGNVAYGSLARAEAVRSFLVEAIDAGLSCAIADPLLPGVMAEVTAANTRRRPVRR